MNGYTDRRNRKLQMTQSIAGDRTMHRKRYRKIIKDLETIGNVQSFTLPPEVVLKRVLTDRMLDRILRRVG